MKAIKAIVEDGNVLLNEPLGAKGRFDAIVVVLDPDPWADLINDPRPRPELVKAGQEALKEFEEGKTTLLDPDRMS